MKSILDPSFRYTNSANTDLRKTFARIRREQRSRASVEGRGRAESAPNVMAIDRRKYGV